MQKLEPPERLDFWSFQLFVVQRRQGYHLVMCHISAGIEVKVFDKLHAGLHGLVPKVADCAAQH